MRHLDAIADLVAARLDRRRLRWAPYLDERLGAELGIVPLIEACRDEHLASLDADDGLAVLLLSWQEIVVRAAARERAPTCARCGARLARAGYRCGRCRLKDQRV